MRNASIAIACILALWGCFVFAQAQPSPGNGSGDVSESRQAMTDIHDIKPLVSVPVPVSWAAVALWTAACIAAGGLLLGAWLLWRRRRGPTAETVAAVLSPEETAFQRLAALSAETGMEGKFYYFQLSFIFREYLQGRFGIDGIEMTTEELLPRMETVAIDKNLKIDSKKFMVSCDPVKYAGAPTFQEAMAADLAFVKSFVEKTTTPVEGSAEAVGGLTTDFPE